MTCLGSPQWKEVFKRTYFTDAEEEIEENNGVVENILDQRISSNGVNAEDDQVKSCNTKWIECSFF